jgi:hypothetical protein
MGRSGPPRAPASGSGCGSPAPATSARSRRGDVRFKAHAAVVAFADESVASEVKTRDAAEAEPLRGRAKAGGVFLAETDDPELGRFRVYVDEPVPPEMEAVCAGTSGSFLLRVPSGRLSVVALGTESPKTDEPPETRTLEIPPGDYAVSVLDGSIKEIPALIAQQEALVDAADWRLHQRVDKVGASGCLFVGLGMIFVLVPTTRREYWYLLPLFLLPTCLYSLLRHLPAYVRVEERRKEHEASLPQVVVVMKRVESTEGLEGGSYRCK